MREAFRREMNRIWQMKTQEFIPEVGRAFHGVMKGEPNQSTSPEALAAILHRTYSMLQGSVKLNADVYEYLRLGEHPEYEDILDGLRTLLVKAREGRMDERDAFTWLAKRPQV